MADNETPEVPEKPSAVKKLLVPAGMALVLVAAIIGGLHFTGMVQFGKQAPPASADAADGEAGAEAGEPVEMVTGPAFYAALRPPMVVQFNSKGKRHFLKVAVDIMSHEQPTIEAFKTHDAVIRNNLILMFQDLDFDVASTRAGIEELQADAEREIEDILEPFVGERAVEGVYFTTFVLQ